jgi:hypothetical protein
MMEALLTRSLLNVMRAVVGPVSTVLLLGFVAHAA